jgi:hypothetical protein
MIRFQCDYAEGAHPAILEKLVETNFDQTVGYGLDPYCDSARAKIKEAIFAEYEKVLAEQDTEECSHGVGRRRNAWGNYGRIRQLYTKV